MEIRLVDKDIYDRVKAESGKRHDNTVSATVRKLLIERLTEIEVEGRGDAPTVITNPVQTPTQQ